MFLWRDKEHVIKIGELIGQELGHEGFKRGVSQDTVLTCIAISILVTCPIYCLGATLPIDSDSQIPDKTRTARLIQN